MAGYLDALRSTLAELLGDNDDERVVLTPPNLSPAVRPEVDQAVERLVAYQGRGYAKLYLDRLGRFASRNGIGDDIITQLARLLADRMAYEDPIRIAQLALADAAIGADGVATIRIDRKCRFRLDELVSALPEIVADPVLVGLRYAGCLRLPVMMRFNATHWLGVRRLRVEASLRRWRLLSVRYALERTWVERWLHMVNRCLVKQPGAVAAVIDSATMVRGYGNPYRYGMADWTLLIDQLVKPVLSDSLAVPDLAAAIVEARAAALPERKQTSLKHAIAAIRKRTTRQAAPGSGPARSGVKKGAVDI
jgi:hypothetical protein